MVVGGKVDARISMQDLGAQSTADSVTIYKFLAGVIV
jgi:hypothetical protein